MIRARKIPTFPRFTDGRTLHDPRSRVFSRTGRVKLYGEDYRDFRWQVYHRAGGRCEMLRNGKRCNRQAGWDGIQCGHVHHEPFRSHGGSDELGQVSWACADCHRTRHPGPQWGRRTI